MEEIDLMELFKNTNSDNCTNIYDYWINIYNKVCKASI